MENKISLAHGSGGKGTNDLINSLFLKYFNNTVLNELNDSALLSVKSKNVAFTTDSFVINPIFFKGGDIGKLSICGTVNDLAVSGAKPMYLSSSFIIEEGFSMESLETIVKSMAKTAEIANVKIVTGDTKVVPKGSTDGIFINTSGIGFLYDNVDIKASNARIGDVIIVNGTLGDHGIEIMCERNNIEMYGNLSSDCTHLNFLIKNILETCPYIHVIRDATRGGLAAVLNEIASMSNISIELEENFIPVKEEVKGTCEMLGLDPLYIANEGKICCFVPEKYAYDVLCKMKNHPLGINASIIGKVVNKGSMEVYMNTFIGGKRIIDMPSGYGLPRIC
ncbi:hydrogenase expression/formation protein HypE [Clostridium sp. P21]|uniref:Hydrogenase expression/formation protein HypE n=1 Tax=Clostridium muellerianum TaxID=2716538 RepID=A0A7Y0HPL9_9CLOT|nr:hydrogenase expression/formation protein HypE [Clostridium muellerianum]NMM63842.1 hydrogenase expression/formation protein HypE [Clostridium muellerianum]